MECSDNSHCNSNIEKKTICIMLIIKIIGDTSTNTCQFCIADSDCSSNETTKLCNPTSK